MGLPILFEINSAEILVKSLPYLNQIGTLLREESALILVIEGHTDANGPSDYNLALSRKRAEAVADYLIGSFAIPPARLRTEGKGESALLRPSSPT
ncbi:OmpA family protein, partial [Rhodospirillum rubrum]|uniref:OmpA family protein n=2 Tax=Rhodospirillum rubrum TaxID=1085 RepID=UPI0028A9C29A